MTPPQHTGVTVIKLHGDYADLEMRNTIDELNTYPAELDTCWTGCSMSMG